MVLPHAVTLALYCTLRSEEGGGFLRSAARRGYRSYPLEPYSTHGSLVRLL